jgi:hypothetical protein
VEEVVMAKYSTLLNSMLEMMERFEGPENENGNECDAIQQKILGALIPIVDEFELFHEQYQLHLIGPPHIAIRRIDGSELIIGFQAQDGHAESAGGRDESLSEGHYYYQFYNGKGSTSERIFLRGGPKEIVRSIVLMLRDSFQGESLAL